MATPVTPATANISAIPKAGSQRYAEYAAAKALGQAYTPGQAAGSAAAVSKAAQEAAQAAATEKSNAQIMSGYQPILDFYKKQEADTTARYAQNAANLKNIFGALTGLSDKDSANIKAQFESSITKQATDLATRTAEQRAAQAAGAAQAEVTGAERGGGPAMVGSPTATATEEAIGQSNAIQTNWAGLMGAQQANALTDIANRGAGYSQQEIAANSQMTQNLQDALSGIGGQVAGIQSQIAQAKVARDQAIANNEYDAAAAAQKTIDELKLQELKNTGSLNVAQTAAAARLAAAQTSAAASAAKTPKAKTYGNNVTGIMQRIADTYSPESAATLQGGFDVILDPTLDPNYAANVKRSPQSTKVPTNASEAYTRWAKKNAADLAAMDAKTQVDIKATARQYFNGQKYTKPATTTNPWSQLMPGVAP